MTIRITGASTASIATTKPAGRSAADFDAILKAFKAEAVKTPAERARDSVLAKHDMTEEDYQRLPLAERQKIDEEVLAAVKKQVEAKTRVPQSQQLWAAKPTLG